MFVLEGPCRCGGDAENDGPSDCDGEAGAVKETPRQTLIRRSDEPRLQIGDVVQIKPGVVGVSSRISVKRVGSAGEATSPLGSGVGAGVGVGVGMGIGVGVGVTRTPTNWMLPMSGGELSFVPNISFSSSERASPLERSGDVSVRLRASVILESAN